MGDGSISFPDKPPQKNLGARRAITRTWLEKALTQAAPEAIRFQRSVLNDAEADPNLRFKVSESILDRFLGKAAQELRVGDTEGRPLVFDSKLAALRAGMAAAEDARVVEREGGTTQAFVEGVLSEIVDREGVVI